MKNMKTKEIFALAIQNHQKNIIKYVAQILACAFLLGIIFFSIFKEVI